MHECPRRKKANVAEFELDDLGRLVAELNEQIRKNEGQVPRWYELPNGLGLG